MSSETYRKYQKLEYLAESIPNQGKGWQTEAKALLDLMGNYYTAVGFPIILREMVNQIMEEDYEPHIKSFFRGKTVYSNERFEAAGEKFSEVFKEVLTIHWEEEE